MNLYLLRHGVSMRKEIGVWGRRFDAPLAPTSVSSLDASKAALSDIGAADAFSSPLLRCTQSLAHVVGNRWNVRIIEEFRAYHSGKFEVVMEVFIQEHFPKYLEKTYAERFNAPEFGEESIADQASRVRKGMMKMLHLATEDVVIVSTHYSVINIIANIVCGNQDASTYGLGRFDVAEGGLLTLRCDPVALLATLSRDE